MSGKKTPLRGQGLADTVAITAGTGAITVKTTNAAGAVAVTRAATSGTGNVVITEQTTSCWTCLDLIRVNNMGQTPSERGLHGGIDKSQGFFDINIKSLAAGKGIELIETPTSIVIASSSQQHVDQVQDVANNPGDSIGLFDRIESGTAWFNRLRAGSGIQLALQNGAIVITNSVQVPQSGTMGAENLGNALGLYVSQTNGILGFRSLSGTSRISLQSDSSNRIQFDVIESAIQIANTSGSIPVNRVNGLHGIATSGSWLDLQDKPSWPTRLIELQDVAGTPQVDQILTFTGTQWEPQTAPAAARAFAQVVVGTGSISATKPEDVLTLAGDSNVLIRVDDRTVHFSLSPTGVTAGDYVNTKLSVDNFGRITRVESGDLGFSDPLQAVGDLLVRDSKNITTRLPTGMVQQILSVGANGVPQWITPRDQGITQFDITEGAGIETQGGPLTQNGSIRVALKPLNPLPTGSFSWVSMDVDQYGRVTGARSNPTPLVDATVTAGVGLTGGGNLKQGEVTLSLSNTGVVAGDYTSANLRVDSQGRITNITSSATTDPKRKITAGVGLAGGGDLRSDVELRLETIGTAGVYTWASIQVDQHGRVISASSNSPRWSRITVGDGLMGGGSLEQDVVIAMAPSGVASGTYVNPTLQVDTFGRVIVASSGTQPGTVQEVRARGNAGIAVAGSPITSTGTLEISLTDTGVVAGEYLAASIQVDTQGRITHAETNELGSAAYANLTEKSLGFTPRDNDAVSWLDAEQRYLSINQNLTDIPDKAAARAALELGDAAMGDGSNLPGIRTASSTIGDHTNAHLFAVAVSTRSTSGGQYSAVIASESSATSASKSAVIASLSSTSGGQYSVSMASNSVTSSGQNSAIVASSGGSRSDGALNTMIAASSASTVGAQAQQTIILASLNTTSSAPNSVSVASNRMILTEGVDDHTLTLGANPTVGAPASTSNRRIQLSAISGNIRISGSVSTGTFSDYAEYFENFQPGVIPLGTIVALRGHQVVPAEPQDSPLGVVSATAGVVLGDTPFEWQGRYLRGDHGELIVNHQGLPRENPLWDPQQPHSSRSARPSEWTLVGLLGQIHVNVDAMARAGDWITPGSAGVGSPCSSPTGIRVMRITRPADDLNRAIALCLVK